MRTNIRQLARECVAIGKVRLMGRTFGTTLVPALHGANLGDGGLTARK